MLVCARAHTCKYSCLGMYGLDVWVSHQTQNIPFHLNLLAETSKICLSPHFVPSARVQRCAILTIFYVDVRDLNSGLMLMPKLPISKACFSQVV